MAIKHLTKTQAFQLLCKSTKKWGVSIYIGNWKNPDEVQKAAPYLDFAKNDEKHENDAQIMTDEMGIILTDTEKECDQIFNQTIGDDGPTKENPYNGPQRIYALTCNPNGELQTENT